MNNETVDNFKNLLLHGNINTLVHSCFINFMNDIDDVSNTNTIDDMVVKMDYRFIKKVSNCCVAFISQTEFL
mgnify:FL=1